MFENGLFLHCKKSQCFCGFMCNILKIKVVTSSTDWDLYLLQNDNGYAANDANVPMTQLMGNGNGNLEVYVNEAYEDEDATKEVHLYWLDNSGSNTADIYIEGYELA